jgi:hypothetical protein
MRGKIKIRKVKKKLNGLKDIKIIPLCMLKFIERQQKEYPQEKSNRGGKAVY